MPRVALNESQRFANECKDADKAILRQIGAICGAAGWSKEHLAKVVIGISVPTWYKLEKQPERITLKMIRDINHAAKQYGYQVTI